MKSDVCFIVAGMDNRIEFLNECIRNFRNSRYRDCDIYLYFQGERIGDVVGGDTFSGVITDSKPRGVFTPRYELMKRFGIMHDYCIIIDDDLFIQPETDYFKTIDFMRKNPNVGATCLTHSRRAVKNEIRIVNDGREYFNVAGGLVLSNRAVSEILAYFKDREADYTFDCFWLLLWVKGYDLAKDFRSWAKHVAARKVNGKWSGFNESRSKMPYIPFMPEYTNDLPEEFNHGKMEVKIPNLDDINDFGREERKSRRNRKEVSR